MDASQFILARSWLDPGHSESVLLSFMKLRQLVTQKSRTWKTTILHRKPQSEAIVSDWISRKDTLELADRLRASAKDRDDQAEAIFWEKKFPKKSDFHHHSKFMTANNSVLIKIPTKKLASGGIHRKLRCSPPYSMPQLWEATEICQSLYQLLSSPVLQ